MRRMQRDRRHKDEIFKDLEVEKWVRLSISPSRRDMNETVDQGLENSVIGQIHIW